MRRTIFTQEHEQFRQTVRAFLEKECVPHTAEWLEAALSLCRELGAGSNAARLLATLPSG